MAQYEQKTDSREFEVANPDQHTGPWGGDSPADAADFAIRLWGAARPDRRLPLTWKTESVLVYMIADLVGASRGRIAEESQAVLAAHFDSCRQAVVAAKRIQTAILEFLTSRPGERTGGAILIYQPRTMDPAGLSGELVQLELGRAKPGQILLADNVFRRMRDLPGMEFATASGETTEDAPTELTELVWTTPDRVALMTESVGDAAEPIVVEAPPVGATLIMNSPIADSPFARSGTTTNTAAPPARMQDYVAPQTGSRRSAEFNHEFNQKPSSSLTEELEIGERPLFTRTRVILGVVAVVVVAALITVFLQPTRVAKPQPHQTAQTQQPTPPTATGGTDQQARAADVPQAQTAQPEQEPPKPPAKPPAALRKPPAQSVTKNKTAPQTQEIKTEDSKDTPEQPAVVDESGNWAVSDIPRLLTMAGNDMGDGKYDKARREYRIVLRLQPKNQPALDGISKLNKIQSDQQ
jgi:hypothetical protein